MPTFEEFLTGKDLIDKFISDSKTDKYYDVEYTKNLLTETNPDAWHVILARAFLWSDTKNEKIWVNLYINLIDGNYE